MIPLEKINCDSSSITSSLVNPRADLNLIPEAKNPITIDKVKEIKTALRNKGEVIMKVSI